MKKTIVRRETAEVRQQRPFPFSHLSTTIYHLELFGIRELFPHPSPLTTHKGIGAMASKQMMAWPQNKMSFNTNATLQSQKSYYTKGY
jgi:hypothetical protein